MILFRSSCGISDSKPNAGSVDVATSCPVLFFFPVFWQEVVSGVIVMVCKEAVQHHGIFLSMEGLVNLQLSSKSVGVFEAFYNSVKVKDSFSGKSCVSFLA